MDNPLLSQSLKEDNSSFVQSQILEKSLYGCVRNNSQKSLKQSKQNTSIYSLIILQLISDQTILQF